MNERFPEAYVKYCQAIPGSVLSAFPRRLHESAKQGRERHLERVSRKAKPTEYWLSPLDRAALRQAYLECDYRRSSCRWVGGEHEVRVVVDAPGSWGSATGSSHTVWHQKKKWKGTNSRHVFFIPSGWRLTVAARGLAVVAGLLTLSVRKCTETLKPGEQAWGATWVVQGRGVSISTESGFVFRLSRRHPWVHGATIASARRVAQKRAAIDLGSSEEDRQEIMVHEAHWTATIQDSWEVGNCRTGTRSWIERYAAGRDRLTGLELRLLAADSGNERAWAVYWHAGKRWLAEQLAKGVAA